MAVFGQTPAGIHISLALANAASVILLFLIGRHILDDVAGIFAAATFGIMSLSPTLMGLTGHANHLLILFVLAGSWLVLRVQLAGNAAADLALSRRLQPLLLLLSGLLFAAALLTTVQGSLFALSAVAYVAWIWIEPRLPKDERRIHPKLVWLMSHLPRKDSPELARKPVLHRPTHVQGLRWLGIQLGTFCAGFFLLLLLGLMLLWRAGALPAFGDYFKNFDTLPGGSFFYFLGWQVIRGPTFCFWVLACLGLALLWWDWRVQARHRFS